MKSTESTNVVRVEFGKPKPKPPLLAAKDRLYWITDLNTALTVASLVYDDQEAVELLLTEVNDRYRRRVPFATLTPEVLQRCAQYLGGDQLKDDIAKSIDMLYSLEA